MEYTSLLAWICITVLCSLIQPTKADAGDVIAGLLGAFIAIVGICAFIGYKWGNVEMPSSGYEETDDFDE
eukprot:CAMPEP_0114667472 /NCGR_PEP_ID=MMETSP0191-20121206/34488_1 /TAXON_ID=126664 /ORGANISM="Sorites sp." /LENGTH=69 /DNA_ID=CAMNT_0001917941 /DNA_START=113 /DNA_END=322 /DNA_ORIENTATION=-